MTTNAGRALLESLKKLLPNMPLTWEGIEARIAAIEAEKEAEVRARLAAEVKALHMMQDGYVVHAMNGTTRTPITPADWVEAYRAAVLARIEPEGEKA